MTRFSDAAGGTDLDQAAFRNAMGLLVTGVAVITARDPGTGEPRGMTANALMSVSLTPPLVVVSVRRGARLHEALRRAGAYGITVLGEGQEAEARRFAGLRVPAGSPDPEFTERTGVPVLGNGLAWIVARVTAAYPAGDHTLFVGAAAALAPERADDPPLAFHRSAFARVAPRPVPVPLQAWGAGLDTWGLPGPRRPAMIGKRL
jgi:flavin reductase (DIM6/NTAB) family NADH-FMN oxidoreductase RutF